MNPKQLKEKIIIPTLNKIGLYSESAVNLLLGTCAQESNMGHFIYQDPAGPALGIYQMEPQTHRNLIVWLNGRPELNKKVNDLVSAGNLYCDRLDELVFNLAYATAMARIRYVAWNPTPLPEANDIPALAAYYKAHYNTINGKATEAQFIDNYRRLVV